MSVATETDTATYRTTPGLVQCRKCSHARTMRGLWYCRVRARAGTAQATYRADGASLAPDLCGRHRCDEFDSMISPEDKDQD